MFSIICFDIQSKLKSLWYLGNLDCIHVKGLVKGYPHRSFLATKVYVALFALLLNHQSNHHPTSEHPYETTTKTSAGFISRLASHWQHR